MTTRRGFLRMFAAAPIAGVAVGVAAKAEAVELGNAKCGTCAARPLRAGGGVHGKMRAEICHECGVAFAVPDVTIPFGQHTHMLCTCPSTHNHGCHVHQTGLYAARWIHNG